MNDKGEKIYRVDAWQDYLALQEHLEQRRAGMIPDDKLANLVTEGMLENSVSTLHGLATSVPLGPGWAKAQAMKMMGIPHSPVPPRTDEPPFVWEADRNREDDLRIGRERRSGREHTLRVAKNVAAGGVV